MRKKTQYIVVNEIYKTIYCGYPQKRAWKIITGSSGGMFLTDSKEDADKVRKWSTQSREDAPWYQHEELGYNYRMSNVIAGVVRGQFPYLDEHITQKRAIYERYREGLKDLPVTMNPIPECCEPNYWLSCLLIDKNAMCQQVRGERDVLYIPEHDKSCPTEILEVISAINAEGRPIWKPMHAQPIYRMNSFITEAGEKEEQRPTPMSPVVWKMSARTSSPEACACPATTK